MNPVLANKPGFVFSFAGTPEDKITKGPGDRGLLRGGVTGVTPFYNLLNLIFRFPLSTCRSPNKAPA
jgi:hypothetical protein